MRYVGTRALALIAGLLVAGTGSALAQDTAGTGNATIDTTAPAGGALDTAGVDTTRDTTDTSGVTNPPGYSGMERDTTMFPDSGGPPAAPGRVEDAATGTYDDSTWQDTTGAAQNPAGYRGMGRAPNDTTTVGEDQEDTASTSSDSTP
jgi:hypothetical protein